MKFIKIAVALLVASSATAHEMTPTYFDIKPTMYDNVFVSDMVIINRNEETLKYQFEVYDDNWVSVPYASFNRVIELAYGESLNVSLYFRTEDVGDVTYICSRSLVDEGVSSLICSKEKGKRI